MIVIAFTTLRYRLCLDRPTIGAVSDFARTRMREDGFYRRILPPVVLTNDELDRSVPTDTPVRVVDSEPDSPAAFSIPFESLPTNLLIVGRRHLTNFDRSIPPPASPEANAVLLNSTTLEDVRRWGRDEIDEQTRTEILRGEPYDISMSDMDPGSLGDDDPIFPNQPTNIPLPTNHAPSDLYHEPRAIEDFAG